MRETDQILWPAHYDPKNCPVHVRNELSMSAASEAAWAWLIRAQLWPSWYPNSSNVRFLEGSPPDLALGTRFNWTTFGIRIESTLARIIADECRRGRAAGFVTTGQRSPGLRYLAAQTIPRRRMVRICGTSNSLETCPSEL
jgi:hypothetical protein